LLSVTFNPTLSFNRYYLNPSRQIVIEDKKDPILLKLIILKTMLISVLPVICAAYVHRSCLYRIRNLQKCADATSSGPFPILVLPSRFHVATWMAYDITNRVLSHAWTQYFPAECNSLMHNNVCVTTYVIININTVLTR